ncbi:pre-mRNA processing RNA-helicase [Zalaria obscura]|uniref:Pre-mRNA processing RNA-helicase n=1 Tax=Zalaria obscura TaxID=2024903 RepID=A0ACC3S569_9PEZI
MSGRPRSPRRGDYDARDRRDYRRDDRRDYRRDDRRDDRAYRRRSPEVGLPISHVQKRLLLIRIQRSHRDQDRELLPRRDRSRDRRYDERLPRYERSRERKRSRERSPARDRRNRSRERATYRDESRDRKRPRRDESTGSRRRRDSRDRRNSYTPSVKGGEVRARACFTNARHSLTGQSNAQAEADKTAAEEKKKAERQAKLAAWKKQQEEKRKEAQAAANVASPSTTPAAASPVAVSSPQATDSAPPKEEPVRPFVGKFDPKAIAKRAAGTSSAPTALDGDIAIPGKSKSAVAPPLARSNHAADTSKKPLSSLSNGKNASLVNERPLLYANNDAGTTTLANKPTGRITGFGLNQQAAENDQHQQMPTVDMDEEEVERKSLVKLPIPELENASEDAAHANGVENHEDEGDDEIADAGTEEEMAAAARAAAERRAAQATDGTPDVTMSDSQTPTQANADVAMAEDEEDIDPLDAFMNGLETPQDFPKRNAKFSSKGKTQEPQAFFSDDEGADLDAMDDDNEDILAMAANKKKKKDIPTVDHSKQKYEPFRKAFYTEPSELKDMSEDDIKALRFELDGIKVRGANVPVPVTKWAQFGLGVQVLDIIRKLGFESPTSIQAQAVPAIMSGRDVIGVAKTGSGKTVAFLLPMFRHIKDQRPLEGLDGPIGLIMAPTRELATQIHRECKPYLKALNLRAVCAYGGAPIKDQIAELKRGAEIIVCTPGRIIDLLAANSGRVTNLRRVTYVVLDEADRMFDMGFEPQVVKLLSNIRPDRQTVLFSATFPRNMEALARKALTKPVEIVVGGRSIVAPEITQMIEVREEDSKFFRVLELLGQLFANDEDARALIFVERQESADTLMAKLQQKAYPCVSVHGGREQIDRDGAVEDFKAGIIPVMIATSVAARGLDVKQLKLVINYDTPNHLEDYVHRCGRTGRAGNTGTAVTFLTPEQGRFAPDLLKALQQSGQPVPDDLKNLAETFLSRVKEGSVRAAGSGFGGKGLDRLDQQREAERQRERRTYKTGDGDDDEEEKEEKKDVQEDKVVVKSRDEPAPAPAATSIPGVPKGIDLDAAIQVHKTETPKPASNNPLDRVSAAAANINNRLGARSQLRSGVPIDNKGPDAGAYHATLEINDFPQKARWAVTNRTNVAKVLEATGTSITSKGNYYPAGKEPAPGEAPKLYILVEGDTELVVTQAMRELQRLLKEGTMAAADSESRAPASGRYNVV